MQDPSQEITVEEKNEAGQTGVQAMETLAWAIAQEFVLAFDDFHNAILEDDEPEGLKARAAAQ